MLSKYLGAVIIAGFVSTSFAGCGSDDNNTSTKPAISESSSQENLPKRLDERKQPIRFDVSGIDVSKQEMDKLIPAARSNKWTEEDVRYVAALLKLCGVDFRRMDERGILHNLPGEVPTACSLSIEGEKNSSREYCVQSIKLVYDNAFTVDRKDNLSSGVEDFYLLKFQEINPKADNAFLKLDSLEQMTEKMSAVLKDKALDTAIIERITMKANPTYNESTRTVVFENQIAVSVAYNKKTNVYGGDPVRTHSSFIFDFDGNLKESKHGEQ